jgi:uncharacterized protein
MAPPYTWPGVYVQEVTSAVQPIAGVGTSTAAFIGVSADIAAAQMPTNATGTPYPQAATLTPVAVNSWLEFTQHFGAIQTANQYLAQAVFGFFNNGGTRCWVIRISATLTIELMRTALSSLESIDEVAIVAAPLPPADSQGDDAAWQALLNQVHGAIVDHCEKMLTRFAILDSNRDIANDNLVISTDATGIWRPADNVNGYGAFYFPWIVVADPTSQTPGATVAVPPSGHLAGVYASNDANRGVFKAPANEVIAGALDLQYPVSKILQGTLNLDGVNCIRAFANNTIKVYGARTLASHPSPISPWQYVNVRRLINFLRESIDTGMQWAVFEPNAEDLWSKVRRNVGAFLNAQWAAGALVGATPAEAYYVICDATTNTPDVQAQGQLVTEIGVAPVQPAEFVIFRLTQWTGPSQ